MKSGNFTYVHETLYQSDIMSLGGAFLLFFFIGILVGFSLSLLSRRRKIK